MALAKGTKRFKHKITGEIRYFKNTPNAEMWDKVGTPGSKEWRWVNDGRTEIYISGEAKIPEGYTIGRLKK
jgi:hypothetical protein